MNKHKNNTPGTSRRKALALLITGGGIIALPQHWAQPVIRTVILPAHAQTTTDQPPPPPPGGELPLVARLSGVVDGDIGTKFTVDASASSGPDGAVLAFSFSTGDDCSLVSQNGATAVVQRHLIPGNCTVSVTVSSGNLQDTQSATARVTGSPPAPP